MAFTITTIKITVAKPFATLIYHLATINKMATYLDTQDILNVEVSCFANYDTPENPRPVRLMSWLTSPKHRAKVDTIRSLGDKVQRDAMKATLPAITPSGLFPYRKAELLTQHSGWLQFDIDQKDNPHVRNYASLKTQLCKLPFVAYCGLSVSGTGYWGLVPIAHPDRHGQHFDALRRVFTHYHINLDDKPRSVSSLRGYSYDPDGWFAPQVMLFELFDEPVPPKLKEYNFNSDGDQEQLRVEVCIRELSRRGAYLADDYGDWYSIGCGLANAFGESGRAYFHAISQYHPTKYQQGATDRQYNACLKAGSQATLGSFFHLCRQVGIEYKDLITPVAAPYAVPKNGASSPVKSRPHVGSEEVVIKQAPTKYEIIQEEVEVLIVEPCDDYPAIWDAPAPQPNHKPLTNSVDFKSGVSNLIGEGFPRAPLAVDALFALRRIRWSVIPDGIAEEDYNPDLPTLMPSPNRERFARLLGMEPDQLPLYQIAPR